MKKIEISAFLSLILCLLVSSSYAQENNIYIEYDKITGANQFYKLDSKRNKVPFDNITASHVRNYDNIVFIVNNINPSTSQLVYSPSVNIKFV